MTDASPITFNTGDGIALSNQPKNSARSGQNRQMTRPSDAMQLSPLPGSSNGFDLESRIRPGWPSPLKDRMGSVD
jgi:hypothetical protein